MSAPRILIVGDEPADRALLETTLQRAGYTIDTASIGEGALAKLRETRFDLLILDVGRVRQSASSLLSTLHGDPAFNHLLTIAMLSQERWQGVLGLFQHVPDVYLFKPIIPAELLAYVKRLLG